MPVKPWPIAIIGAGGIVHDAHLPAYRKAGWAVAGICDPAMAKAEALAAEFGIPAVFSDLETMVAAMPADVVYDIAVPASVLPGVLAGLPEKAVVMMQKPMGEHIAGAEEIVGICRRKGFTAAVNFQMRFIPAVQLAKKVVESGLIGSCMTWRSG